MPLLSHTRKAAQLAPPLPVQNQLFDRADLRLRMGQFSLVAAAPSVGKSLLATNIAIRTKVPTLYFSADSDEFTVHSRACSILSGYPLDQVEASSKEETWEEFFKDRLRRADHIDWCYQTDINTNFIWKRVQANATMRGGYPYLVIVDNLANTTTGSDNEYAELREICRDLQAMARLTGSHIMACHHVKGAKENGFYQIDLGDLLGNIGKIPEQVLGLNFGGSGFINAHVAKNRSGKARHSFGLPVDYTTATIGGFTV